MNENRCVFCGEIIPEGRQVCPMCEQIQKETTRAERFDDAMHDWVLPVGIGALIVILLIFVLKTG